MLLHELPVAKFFKVQLAAIVVISFLSLSCSGINIVQFLICLGLTRWCLSVTCLPSTTLSCSCEIFCFEPSRRLSFNFVLRTGTLDNGCHNSDNDLVMKLQIRSVNTGRLRTAAGAKTNKSPISCSKNRLNEESSIPPLSRQWTPRQPVGRSMPHVWERNFLSTRTAGAAAQGVDVH